MVGFDDDLLVMKARVCGESSKLQVLPIFGMGGIGKTTLARHVYHAQLIRESFDIRAWVTVSQDYSVKEILSGLVVSLKILIGTAGEEKDGVRVYKALKGRRYLIVLDDMWSTEAWDDVKYIFPDDGNGSRILLTTRLADVAAYPDPYGHLHEMQFMDADNSWYLLQQKVFNQQHCPPELEKIGKEIARSCRGLPLAVVVVAGLLSTASKNLALWEEIAAKLNSAGNTEQGQIGEILSLSYSQLPHHLRQCFLYMAAFPEDHKIHVSRVIKLWVAEGFCRSHIASKSLEEEGEEFLEDLVKRSLVLVNERKSNGKIKSLSMHDLMRDLCIRKAREEKFLVHVNDRYVDEISLESINNQRRASITVSYQDYPPLEVYGRFRGSTVRTFMLLEPHGTGTLNFCAQNLRSLKVLNAFNNTPHQCFSPPAEIFELIHLRFFAFPVIEIPVSISNLQNLQTLIIPHASVLTPIRLPLEIWRMPKLRHLLIYACVLPSPKGETSVLENLQTLSKTRNLVCTKRILHMIPNVKRLGLSYSNSNYVGDWHLDNLVKLNQLESLTLTVRHRNFLGKHKILLWEKLNPVFPTSLRKLSLRGSWPSGDAYFVLPPECLTIVGLLPNLEVLKLRGMFCQDSKWETNEGGFPQLKTLLIKYSNLQYWITESSHFPSLRSLLLHQCEKLTDIPDGIGEITTLELIEIDKRNISLVESAKRIKEEQQSFGNEDIQVRIVS